MYIEDEFSCRPVMLVVAVIGIVSGNSTIRRRATCRKKYSSVKDGESEWRAWSLREG